MTYTTPQDHRINFIHERNYNGNRAIDINTSNLNATPIRLYRPSTTSDLSEPVLS